jgi:hypothetical protein
MGLPDSRGFDWPSSRSVADVTKRREHVQGLNIGVKDFFSMVLGEVHPQKVS